MFYTLIEMFVYNLMLPFHKIWDITKKLKLCSQYRLITYCVHKLWRVLLHRFFAKLFFKKASIKPRHRSGATVRFLCQAFFLVKESGEGRDTSFPSPQTPLPQEPSRDCCKSLGSSLGGMRRLLCGATARPALPVVKRLRLTACLGGLSTA